MISSSLSIPRFEFPAIRLWAILGGLLSVSVFGLGTVQASDAATQRAHKQQREEMARSIRAERERRLASRPVPAPAAAPSLTPTPLAAPAQPLAAEFTARSVPVNPGQAKAHGMNADERRQMREQLRQQNQQRRADHQESFAP